jgi:multiple sugar transport system ATP-binding protein
VLLSIEELLDRRPATLSGGQRQRVAVGRALVRRPKAFLLDEPLSNVDAKLRAEMRLELRSLQLRLGATFVYVTHDQLEAMTMADQIAIMNRGSLLQVGTPDEVYSRPAWRFVAEFIGSPPMNLFEGNVKTVRDNKPVAVLGPWCVPLVGSTSAATCTVGVHFEDLSIVEAPGDVPGTVETVEHLGPEKRVVLATELGKVGVRADRSSRVSVGAQVGIVADVEKMHVFDGDTQARVKTRADELKVTA